MLFNWEWILSPVKTMERRMDFSFGLASSAISSSDRMQRLISSDTLVSGSRAAK